MFKVRAYLINTSLACFDLALTAACYLSVLRWELRSAGRSADWQALFATEHVLALGGVLGVWVALLFYFRMYHSRRMDSVFADVSVLSKVALAGLVVLGALAHFIPALSPTPLLLVHFVAINFVVMIAMRVGVRIFLRELRRRGHNTKVILMVTSPTLGDRLAQKIAQQTHYGYRILHRLNYTHAAPKAHSRLLQDFQETIRSARVDDVILALPAKAHELSAQLVEECENFGIQVRLVPDLFPLIQSDTQVYDLDGIPLISVRLYPTEDFGYVVLKRAFDLVVSLAVVILFSPLFLLIALLIKVSSKGPILFTQERVGLNGKRFKMLKFRTMRPGAPGDAGTRWTRPNDPHVTPLGRWLRRSNLDELPQFLNVLKGDMSIVGPRPERPFFLAHFREEIPGYMLRHYAKCGITGWAQVNGWRGDTSIQERLAHDLYYIRNWALAFDLKIIFMTLTRSFFHRNAY